MSGQQKTNSPLEQLLEEIKFQRRKELRSQVGNLFCLHILNRDDQRVRFNKYTNNLTSIMVNENENPGMYLV